MCVNGVAFVNIRYTKGVTFLSKIVYKKAGVGIRGRGFRPYKMLLTTPWECVVLTFESVLVWPLKRNPFSSTLTWYYLFRMYILTFESVDEILWCDHLNDTSSAVFSHCTIYLACSSTFWVWRWNPNETSSAVLSHGTIYLECNSNFWVCG